MNELDGIHSQIIEFYLKKIFLIKFKTVLLNKIFWKIYRTPFYVAVKTENIEIIKLLLSNNKLNINTPYIVNSIVNQIQKKIQLHLISDFPILFKFKKFNDIRKKIIQWNYI